MDLLSSNIAIFAFVDLLALFASCVFVWRGLRRASRFVRLWAQTSFERALVRARLTSQRQAYRCATDQSYYSSRLALFGSANLLGAVAVVITAIGATIEPDRMSATSVSTWRWTADFFLLLFAAFTGRSVFRTVNLARRVMEVRRRLRRVSCRGPKPAASALESRQVRRK